MLIDVDVDIDSKFFDGKGNFIKKRYNINFIYNIDGNIYLIYRFL